VVCVCVCVCRHYVVVMKENEMTSVLKTIHLFHEGISEYLKFKTLIIITNVLTRKQLPSSPLLQSRH